MSADRPDGPATDPGAPPDARSADLAMLTSKARDHLRMVDKRRRLFGADGGMFVDPAWCLLLDLFVHGPAQTGLPILSCAIASRVPISTAHRYIALLEDKALIERKPNPNDGRSALLSLTPLGEELVLSTLV